MLDSRDILKIMAAVIAANEMSDTKDRYQSVDESLKKSAEIFGINYEKMLEANLDAKIENIVRILDRNQ